MKLQALVRGHNVRKQANATLWCMQALAHAHARVKDHRLQLSRGARDKTSFSCDANLWSSALPEKRFFSTNEFRGTIHGRASTDVRAAPVVPRNQVFQTPSPSKARLARSAPERRGQETPWCTEQSSAIASALVWFRLQIRREPG